MKDDIINVSLAILVIFGYGAMLWLCALLEG